MMLRPLSVSRVMAPIRAMANTNAADPQSQVSTTARLPVEGPGCATLLSAALAEAGEDEEGDAKLILP